MQRLNRLVLGVFATFCLGAILTGDGTRQATTGAEPLSTDGGVDCDSLVCDDGNPCTNDTCDPASGCVHGYNSASCDDGNACTTADFCSAGICYGGAGVLCGDTNPCTDDSCDPAVGCVHTNNTAPCEDLRFCTVGDTCSGGVCQSGGPRDCDDGNLCTNDLCFPNVGCYHEDNGATCNDGNPCTFADHCQSGGCQGVPFQCNDGNPCTNDGCVQGGCVFTNNTFPCSDLNACTVGDICGGGTCHPGSPVTCDDGNPCTDDSCNPASGCVYTNNTAPCSDGNACTDEDTCGGGSCHAGGPRDCNDGNPCTNDMCNPFLGCLHSNNNTASCSDGNACTTGDRCSGGVCQSAGLTNCDDGNLCTDDSCDPQTGCVHTNNSASCDDGNACTAGDACGNGVCQSGAPVNGDDGNPCTDDTCDPVLGGIHTNNTAPCDDGNGCTEGDVCVGGSCASGPPRDCDDRNPCTADACGPPPVGLCQHFPISGSCDDGNACTSPGTCDATGHCVNVLPVFCSDGNPCTNDSCNPASGCVYVNNDFPCDDGNGCTVGDACGGGSCHGGAPVVCTASDQCHVAGICGPGSNTCSNPVAADGTACNDGNPGTQNDTCQAGVCTGGSVCTSTNDPKTLGWWSSQCTTGGHSGESIDDADAACVAASTPAFAGITTAAQVCEVLSAAHGNNTQADKAEKQVMTLALNICSQRICPSQGLDATCSNIGSVGQALSDGSAVLVNPQHTNPQLAIVECQATEINNGHALELDTLTMTREGSGVRVTWAPPTLDDGSGTPNRYKVWRRPMGSMAAFTQIGITTGLTFLDATPGTTAWQYDVTSVF